MEALAVYEPKEIQKGTTPADLLQMAVSQNADLDKLEKVKTYFSYNPNSGVVSWKKKINRNTIIGSEAGFVWWFNKKYTSYKRIGFFGSYIFAHHVAFVMMKDRFPTSDIDHINGNGLDNKWSNLREVSHKENMKNQKLNCKNTSKQIGIGFHKATKKWRVRLVVNKKEHHVGVFEKLEEAILVRDSEYKIFGFHENHGRI